jgi:hypothetical protein
MKLNDETQWFIQDGNILDIEPQVAESLNDLADLYPNEWLILEKEQITLPSSLGGSGPLLCMAGMSPLFHSFYLHTYTL